MAINVVENPKSSPKDKNRLVENLVFIALNFLVIPISAWQTYSGYLEVVDYWILSAGIAAISGLLMLAMNIGIRNSRLEGRKHLWQTLFYIVPLGFSFFGNFNAFYSSQMKNELFDVEISKYEKVLNKTHADAIGALDASTGLPALEGSMNSMLNTIRSQYFQPMRQGWGKECEKGWKELTSILEAEDPHGGHVTALLTKRPSIAETIAREYFDGISQSKLDEIEPHKLYVDAQFNEVKDALQAAQDSQSISAVGLSLLDDIKDANNNIGSRTQGFLPDFAYEELSLSEHNQQSTIKHTLKSAFVDMPNPSASFFSLFLSLIIDLAALIYILLFIPYNKNVRRRLRDPREI